MYVSSPSVIHATGHSFAHAPHFIHFSVILYAILFHLLSVFSYF